MKEMYIYEVRCLKSNEDMILALARNCLMNLKNSVYSCEIHNRDSTPGHSPSLF